MNRLIQQRQRGLVSVIGLLFLSAVVLFILMQSINMTGSKGLETQQYVDGVGALAMAENGRETAIADISKNVNLNDSSFLSTCQTYDTGTYSMGSGKSFSYVTASTQPSSSMCPVRVRGVVGSASRTIETQFNFNTSVGTGGYGQNPTMTLKNTYNNPALAIFNLAWRRQGSTGQSPPGGQASAYSCDTCGTEWNIESSSGSNAVGSMGTALAVGATKTVTATPQTIDSPRNYSEVGLILGGYSSTPAINGCYADNKETANTSSSSTTGTVPGPKAKSTCAPTSNNWCDVADTIVFGVSGRGNNNVSASFTALTFNGTPIAPEPVATPSWMAHYPNTDGSSPPIMKGDVFSEIWYRYNKRISDMTGGNSPENPTAPYTITVADTSGLTIGTIVQVNKNNAGYFEPYTKVTKIVDSTHFEVDKAPKSRLQNNATICTGICALFSNPWDANNKTVFVLTRDASLTDQQWAAGAVCLSGVNPAQVRRIASSSLTVQKWHEVVSGE